MTLEWIWIVFLFAMGGCIGSFLNVVIYRLPREKSLVTPPSACPKCGRHIPFYYNVPMLSWLVLRGRCRFCAEPIAFRYFVIELSTALLFVAAFLMFFVTPVRTLGIEAETGVGAFTEGGWVVYLATVTLWAALLAASAIDLELWVIPLSLCWFVTGVGLALSALAPLIINPVVIRGNYLFPSASAATGALAAGGTIGLIVALVLLATGRIKRSYDFEEHPEQDAEMDPVMIQAGVEEDPDVNHRAEILREVVFLTPVVAGALIAWALQRYVPAIERTWLHFSQIPVVAGLLGSLWGYLVGAGVVWATRIFGTLGFGKEAMGLGDVHLMGAAGAILGPMMVTLAFFAAPFYGLTWAVFQMFFRKTRQIPYGPFLSLGVVTVMIFHDWLRSYIANVYLYR